MELSIEKIPHEIKIEMPLDPAIPLLGKILKELKSSNHSNTCVSRLPEAQFIIAESWKQPRHPSPDGWIKTELSLPL